MVDNSYEVEKLSLSESLPDLRDVLKNPEKYEKPKGGACKKLMRRLFLNNISNVQFKPFYDGSETFEILNDFEAPSVDDIQNEFNQFGNFEITKEEDYIVHSEHKEYDDFESLYSNEYFDLDNIKEEDKVKEEPEQPIVKEEFVPLQLERKIYEKPVTSRQVRNQLSDDIMKKIQETKAERLERREKVLQRKASPKQEETSKKQSEIKCIIDNETYTIISTTEFSEGKGCHLAKKRRWVYRSWIYWK